MTQILMKGCSDVLEKANGCDLSDPVSHLGLPLRVENYLKKAGIYTLSDLKSTAYEELFNIKGVGSWTLNILMAVKDLLEQKTVKIISSVESPKDQQNEETRKRVLALPIEVLELPRKTENALIKAGIFNLKQFLNFPEERFIKIPMIGVNSVELFLKIKNSILDKPEDLLPEVKSTLDNIHESTKTEVVLTNEKVIDTLKTAAENERGQELIFRRYGLTTGEAETLEEIGQTFGVTRERIRQIQVKIIRRLRHPTRRNYFLKIAELIFPDNDYLLSEEEADIIVPQVLKDTNLDGSSLFDLISDLKLIQHYKIGDIKIYSPLFSDISLEEFTSKILNLIKEKNLGLDVGSISKLLFDDLGKIKIAGFNSEKFILKYCKLDPRIEENNNLKTYSDSYEKNREALINFRYYTVSHHFTRAWVELMVRVLMEENAPLHFTEITHKVNELIIDSDHSLDVRRAHSILIENPEFAHSGVRGTWGLIEWGIRKESTPQLVSECLKKAGFPLHWKQIYNYVSKYKDTKPINIMAVLNSRPEFEEKSHGVYWFTEKNGEA